MSGEGLSDVGRRRARLRQTPGHWPTFTSLLLEQYPSLTIKTLSCRLTGLQCGGMGCSDHCDSLSGGTAYFFGPASLIDL